MKIRLLNRKEIRQTLTMAMAIELMNDAFIALTQGSIDVPLRTSVSNARGTMLYKPALMQSANLFGMKAVSVFPSNVEAQLPVTTGLMLINDAKTGLPVSLMDAEYLTALRTGAASGLATRLLANPETKTAALFGTGGQAACQLQAMLEVLPLKTVHVFSRTKANAEEFCLKHQPVSNHGATCVLKPATSRDVLRECGLITTVTTSKSPVFRDEEISAGVHINGVGSFTPDRAEIPAQTICRGNVFVDHREAALREAGDIVMAMQSGTSSSTDDESNLPANFSPVEIGEVLLGEQPGRIAKEQLTIFKSVGNAAQDIVCAAEIINIAQTRNLGQVIDL
jgi:ornithine cyclodeaminase/alanine dehydrogenase-like protein (mu-crystallin family)